MADTPLRLVIDTNVVLDLFVFDDPGVALLAAALGERRAVCFADAEGIAEFERVLGYDALRLSPADAAQALARYRALAQDGVATPLPGFPRCADPDDQKFLLLAVAVAADYLVTRDRALLKMARRVGRIAPALQIVRPEQLSTILDSPA